MNMLQNIGLLLLICANSLTCGERELLDKQQAESPFNPAKYKSYLEHQMFLQTSGNLHQRASRKRSKSAFFEGKTTDIKRTL